MKTTRTHGSEGIRGRFLLRGTGRLVAVATLLVLLLPACETAAEARAAADHPAVPKMPETLWAALQYQSYESMIRLDWRAATELPALGPFFDASVNDPARGVPVAGLATELYREVPVFRSGEVQEVWIAAGSMFGGRPIRVWASTDSSPERLRRIFEESGWWEVPEEDGFLAAPLARYEKERLHEMMEEKDGAEEQMEEKIAKLRGLFARSHWRALITVPGWIILSPPSRSMSVRARLVDPGAEKDWRAAERFPWKELAKPLDGALAVIVMDIRENDKPPGKKPAGSSLPAANEGSDEARLRRVRQEIRALDTRDDKVVLGEMGDMVFRLTEVDGGLAVDGTIALPDGRGPGAHSPIFLGMLMQIGALSTLTLAPGLSQEITGAIIRQEEDRLEVSAVLSTASLLEGARGLVAQKTRLQELRQEEQELARRIRERKNDE